MPTQNETKNQHYYSQAEQRLNAADPAGKRIYALRLLDRGKRTLRAAKKVSIRSNLAFGDLFSLDVNGKERTNLEESFQRFETNIRDHSKELIDALRARDDARLKKPLIEVLAAKLSNMARNPFSVKKGLNTFADVLGPDYAQLFADVSYGNKPQKAAVCARFNLTADEYDRWLKLLVRLHHPINPPYTLLEHLVKDLLEQHYVEAHVYDYSPGSDGCLLSDRSVNTHQAPGMLMFEFNISSFAFATFFFVDVNTRIDPSVLPHVKAASMKAVKGTAVVRHFPDDLEALKRYNGRVIDQCAEQVFSASPRMPTVPTTGSH